STASPGGGRASASSCRRTSRLHRAPTRPGRRRFSEPPRPHFGDLQATEFWSWGWPHPSATALSGRHMGRIPPLTLLAGLLLLRANVAPAGVQTAEQHRCILALNRAGAKLSSAAGQDALRCLNDAATGALSGDTAEHCLIADRDG